MIQLQLSENFWLSEFLSSQTAERNPEVAEDQFNPPNEVVDCLRYLCENTIQPLRTLLKTPMRISSGYRSPALNAAIGGSKSSQHMRGEAADIILSEQLLHNAALQRQKEIVENLIYERVGRWVRDDVNSNFYLFAAACLYLNELDVDQLIHEYGTPGAPAWVHVSASRHNNKRQILMLPQKQNLTLEEALLLGC